MSWYKKLETLKFPHLFDYVTKRNSATLTFAYVTFLVTIGSIIALHFNKDFFVATSTAILFWVLTMVFYMLRGRLTSFKLDLDDKTIEIEGKSEENS